MKFSNIFVYRLLDWNRGYTAEELNQRMKKFILQQCSGFDTITKGWVPPNDKANDCLSYQDNGYILFCIGVQKKLLPSQVIKQELKKRADKYYQEEGRKLGRKQTKELKELITEELLPRAFTIQRNNYGWISLKNNLVVVEASSQTVADDFINLLSKSFDSFSCSFIKPVITPKNAMKEWMVSGSSKHRLSIDDYCELRGTGDKSCIRFENQIFVGSEIAAYLESDMEISRLALTWNDRLSFVLTSNFQLKKISILDIARTEIDDAEDDEFASNFSLITAEYTSAILELLEALEGEAEL